MTETSGIVLIIDDEETTRNLVATLLRDGNYQIEMAVNGRQGIERANALRPDVILLDVMMPGMDGFEVCRRLRTHEDLSEVPIMMLTALDDKDSKITGLAAGADAFLSKPLDRVELQTRVRATVKMNRYRKLDEARRLLERAHVDLQGSYEETIEGWSRALDLRDKETEGHTQRVTALTLRLARADGMSPEELVQVRRGALLHDIGKLGVPDSILHKPGSLSDDEWALMRLHPVYAYDLLYPIAYLRPSIDIPYCHHEKWDGTGYPRGLSKDDIPWSARIFAVIDVWDALRSDRPYRQAWSVEKTRAHIESIAGTHLDTRAVELFARVVDS